MTREETIESLIAIGGQVYDHSPDEVRFTHEAILRLLGYEIKTDWRGKATSATLNGKPIDLHRALFIHSKTEQATYDLNWARIRRHITKNYHLNKAHSIIFKAAGVEP